jgi:hypothetical protein
MTSKDKESSASLSWAVGCFPHEMKARRKRDKRRMDFFMLDLFVFRKYTEKSLPLESFFFFFIISFFYFHYLMDNKFSADVPFCQPW